MAAIEANSKLARLVILDDEPRETGDDIGLAPNEGVNKPAHPVPLGPDIGIGEDQDFVFQPQRGKCREQIGRLLTFFDRTTGDNQVDALGRQRSTLFNHGNGRIAFRLDSENDTEIRVILLEKPDQELIEFRIVALYGDNDSNSGSYLRTSTFPQPDGE